MVCDMSVLQPRIQRLVRKRFGKAPANEHEKDELASTLYSSLMEHVSKSAGLQLAVHVPHHTTPERRPA